MKKILFIIIGVIIAVAVLTTVRILTFKEEHHAHFHANFAVFIDGNKLDFSSIKYMEPVSSCTTDIEETPQSAIGRVHLHSSNGETIHVHADGVTWNAFLNNIRFNAGKDYLVTDDGKIYGNTDTSKVKYILNGESIDNPMNYEIKSEDRLLINYGTESNDQVMKRFEEVSSNAKEFNEKNDPATCSGHTDTDFWTKLKKSFVN